MLEAVMPDFAAIGYKDEDLALILVARDGPIPERGPPFPAKAPAAIPSSTAASPAPGVKPNSGAGRHLAKENHSLRLP